MGGGCYGTFYASQLAKAKARGKVDFRSVIVVDRDADCRARRELGDAVGALAERLRGSRATAWWPRSRAVTAR